MKLPQSCETHWNRIRISNLQFWLTKRTQTCLETGTKKTKKRFLPLFWDICSESAKLVPASLTVPVHNQCFQPSAVQKRPSDDAPVEVCPVHSVFFHVKRQPLKSEKNLFLNACRIIYLAERLPGYIHGFWPRGQTRNQVKITVHCDFAQRANFALETIFAKQKVHDFSSFWVKASDPQVRLWNSSALICDLRHASWNFNPEACSLRLCLSLEPRLMISFPGHAKGGPNQTNLVSVTGGWRSYLLAYPRTGTWLRWRSSHHTSRFGVGSHRLSTGTRQSSCALQRNNPENFSFLQAQKQINS